MLLIEVIILLILNTHNIVLYNKTLNKAYYEHITPDMVDDIIFSGLNAGEYYIGIYESMFYDIVNADTDIRYAVNGATSVAITKDSSSYYNISIDQSGIVISVVVTKQYDNWLYSI